MSITMMRGHGPPYLRHDARRRRRRRRTARRAPPPPTTKPMHHRTQTSGCSVSRRGVPPPARRASERYRRWEDQPVGEEATIFSIWRISPFGRRAAATSTATKRTNDRARDRDDARARPRGDDGDAHVEALDERRPLDAVEEAEDELVTRRGVGRGEVARRGRERARCGHGRQLVVLEGAPRDNASRWRGASGVGVVHHTTKE